MVCDPAAKYEFVSGNLKWYPAPAFLLGVEVLYAHVDTAFKTYETTGTTPLAGQPQPVPVAVAEICRLTWMCAPAPAGPDIHANRAGYGVIAQAFAAAFGRF